MTYSSPSIFPPLFSHLHSDGEWTIINNMNEAMVESAIDVPKTDTAQTVHCIVCLSKDENDCPKAEIISAHLNEINANQLLNRLNTIADPAYSLFIQSIPLEK